MERDRRRIELLNSLLLSMPGTPTLYYGDEIGMGDNIYLGDRDGVRTPMQWSIDRNGGFSRADPASLVLPPIMDSLYGYQTVNVETQAGDPHSLLNWTRRLLAVRKQQKAFGRGNLKMLSPNNRRILAYTREYTGPDGKSEIILCVANLSRTAQAAELELSAFAGRVPVEMLGGNAFPPIGQLSFLLTLPPYGFYWFLLASQTQMPSWHVVPVQVLPDFTTVVLKKRLEELLEHPSRTTLEQTVLPEWLSKRRWFAGKHLGPEQIRLVYGVRFGDPKQPVLLGEIEVTAGGESSRYQLPFGLLAEDQINAALPQQLAMARVRRGRQVGLITDAFSLESFVRALIDGMRSNTVLAASDGELHFQATAELKALDLPADMEVRYVSSEQSNSSVVVAERVMLKLIRKVSAGVHPELEMGAYLTAAGFRHISPMLGSLVRRDARGEDTLLMVAQGLLANQGDAWSWTQNNLERAIRDELADAVSEHEQHYNALGELADFAALLGQRLGEMHQVLAVPTVDPAFSAQVSTTKDAQYWGKAIGNQMEHALRLLKQHRQALPEDEQALVDCLLQDKEAILEYIWTLAGQVVGGLRLRVHGDLHLGQVLVVQGDAYLIDFEGEPARSLQERRGKHSPYKDVCGVLRSFDYAAAMAYHSATVLDPAGAAVPACRRVTRRYLKEACEAFIQAYRRATASLVQAWQDPAGEEAALILFSLEKAAYEIVYEAENRPTWLGVPLHGLSGLLSELNTLSGGEQ